MGVQIHKLRVQMYYLRVKIQVLTIQIYKFRLQIYAKLSEKLLKVLGNNSENENVP